MSTTAGSYGATASVIPSEPVPRKRYASTFRGVCSYIICNEFCERLAFYGFQGSLLMFMTKELGLQSGDAATQSAMFSGMCYITPLIGGIVADSFLGR